MPGAMRSGQLVHISASLLPTDDTSSQHSFWHAGTDGLLKGFITMAESMIHFSTVRSLQPPTNLSTLCQDGNAGPTQVPTNDDV